MATEHRWSEISPITGKKVVLRLMTGADTQLIVRWRNNPRVRANFIYRKTFTNSTHENWIREDIETGRALQFIICDKSDSANRPVGSVYFRDIDIATGTAEYGIFIGEDDAIGRGFGNEAAILALDFAFNILKMDKIMLRVFCTNIAAFKSYEHAGFKIVSTQKDVKCSDGSTGDMYIMETDNRKVIK